MAGWLCQLPHFCQKKVLHCGRLLLARVLPCFRKLCDTLNVEGHLLNLELVPLMTPALHYINSTIVLDVAPEAPGAAPSIMPTAWRPTPTHWRQTPWHLLQAGGFRYAGASPLALDEPGRPFMCCGRHGKCGSSTVWKIHLQQKPSLSQNNALITKRKKAPAVRLPQAVKSVCNTNMPCHSGCICPASTHQCIGGTCRVSAAVWELC